MPIPRGGPGLFNTQLRPCGGTAPAHQPVHGPPQGHREEHAGAASARYSKSEYSRLYLPVLFRLYIRCVI